MEPMGMTRHSAARGRLVKVRITDVVNGKPSHVDPTLQTSNLEPASSDGSASADTGEKVDTRFCVHFHSRRRRLTDPDGLYSKAALDGLVRGGILVDDSARFVKEVSFSQEVSEVEETVIEVWR
jgi:hypothetical protein